MFFSHNLCDTYIIKFANKDNNFQIYFLPISFSLVILEPTWDPRGSQWDPAAISDMGPTWFPHSSH